MALKCTTEFTCDRSGLQTTITGDTPRSDPPQNWVRLNHDRTIGQNVQTTVYQLCPACVAELSKFLANQPTVPTVN